MRDLGGPILRACLSGKSESTFKSLWLSFSGENTGLPSFENYTLPHFAFYKRPILVLVFDNGKKFKEDFHF